jgi:hypothetical protein
VIQVTVTFYMRLVRRWSAGRVDISLTC